MEKEEREEDPLSIGNLGKITISSNLLEKPNNEEEEEEIEEPKPKKCSCKFPTSYTFLIIIEILIFL